MKHIRIHVDVAQVVFHVSFVVGVKFQYSRTAPINFHSVTLTNYERKKKTIYWESKKVGSCILDKNPPLHPCCKIDR
jgi:hypothetical protein